MFISQHGDEMMIDVQRWIRAPSSLSRPGRTPRTSSPRTAASSSGRSSESNRATYVCGRSYCGRPLPAGNWGGAWTSRDAAAPRRSSSKFSMLRSARPRPTRILTTSMEMEMQWRTATRCGIGSWGRRRSS